MKNTMYPMDDFAEAHYSEDDYASLGWSPEILAAASAIYGRIHLNDKEFPVFSQTDLDTLDHYCIAAENAINAYHRESAPDTDHNDEKETR